MFKETLGKLFEGQNLTRDEMKLAMGEVLQGNCTEAQIGAFLASLRCKGESADEIIGAVEVLREKSTKVVVSKTDIVDTCGTGGDKSGTFNISTASAIVTAAAGVPVAKHGNRAMSSACGSANVLQELGLNLDLSPEKVGQSIDEYNIGFLFAMNLHGAMKHVGPARQQIGQRTIFNILGPMLNPAGARRQIFGVFDAGLTETLADVLHKTGSEHVMVVAGTDGLDELSTISSSVVTELKKGELSTYEIHPEELDLPRSNLKELLGGDAKTNANIIRTILDGEPGAPRDIVCLNAGAAIYVGGKALDLKDGIQLAAEAIDSGKAKKTLEDFVNFSNSN